MYLQFFTGNGARQLDTPTRLLAGALAGITSVSESPSSPSTIQKILTHFE
jgi:hypothetical protein